MRVDHLARKGVVLARAAAEGVDVMAESLQLLEQTVGADVLSVSAMRLGAAVDAEVSLRGADPMGPEELELWPELMPSHPYLPHVAAGPVTASRLTDVVDLVAFEGTELYQQLLRPRGSRYQAALILERGPSSMLLLALWRAGRDFTDEELAALETFRRLMAAALAFRAAIDDALQAAPMQRPGSALTPRQRQVAVLLESGLTNEQIARSLRISPRTVRKHLEGLFEATGARSRTEVAVRWRQGGASAT